MPLRLLAAGKTDVGLQREQNEDAFDKKVMGDSASSGIFIVSDGMGGYHAGEIASQIAVETITGALAPLLDPNTPATTVKLTPRDAKRKTKKNGKKDASVAESTTSTSDAVVSDAVVSDAAVSDAAVTGADESAPDDFNPLETRALSESIGVDHYSGKVSEAVRLANSAIVEYGESHKDARGLGATVTAAFIVDGQAFIANVGDSRTYLIRDGKIARVTRDHSLVQRLVEMEQIAADEVYEHPSRNLIYRSLGAGHTDVDVDIFHERLRVGDTLLLCCDGLW
ncbi:MAG: PP2C family protein-serine/threonine phosphatase, partial [Ktedonobacterales bacterium]